MSMLSCKYLLKILENRSHLRWQKVHSMEEAKITLKLLFKYIEEDRRKQCIKESEFMVCMNSKIYVRKNLILYITSFFI